MASQQGRRGPIGSIIPAAHRSPQTGAAAFLILMSFVAVLATLTIIIRRANAAPGPVYIRGLASFTNGKRVAGDVVEYKYPWEKWPGAKASPLHTANVGYNSVWWWRGRPYIYNYTGPAQRDVIILVRLRNTETGKTSSAVAVATSESGDLSGEYARVKDELRY